MNPDDDLDQEERSPEHRQAMTDLTDLVSIYHPTISMAAVLSVKEWNVCSYESPGEFRHILNDLHAQISAAYPEIDQSNIGKDRPAPKNVPHEAPPTALVDLRKKIKALTKPIDTEILVRAIEHAERAGQPFETLVVAIQNWSTKYGPVDLDELTASNNTFDNAARAQWQKEILAILEDPDNLPWIAYVQNELDNLLSKFADKCFEEEEAEPVNEALTIIKENVYFFAPPVIPSDFVGKGDAESLRYVIENWKTQILPSISRLARVFIETEGYSSKTINALAERDPVFQTELIIHELSYRIAGVIWSYCQ